MRYPDNETLIQKFQLTSYIIHRQIEGITDEESVVQPPVRGNCMNWILGHILTERCIILSLLHEELVLDEETIERYRRASSPILGMNDGLPFHELVAAYDRSQELIEKALKTITPEQLAAKGKVGDGEDEVGAIIAYIHWHETYHTGQFELLRQLAGKNDEVIK